MHGFLVGACMPGGGYVMHTHLRDTAGQCAGGTHPTGMHSCLKINTDSDIE